MKMIRPIKAIVTHQLDKFNDQGRVNQASHQGLLKNANRPKFCMMFPTLIRVQENESYSKVMRECCIMKDANPLMIKRQVH